MVSLSVFPNKPDSIFRRSSSWVRTKKPNFTNRDFRRIRETARTPRRPVSDFFSRTWKKENCWFEFFFRSKRVGISNECRRYWTCQIVKNGSGCSASLRTADLNGRGENLLPSMLRHLGFPLSRWTMLSPTLLLASLSKPGRICTWKQLCLAGAQSLLLV